jgi:hypothetical protein
MDEGLILLLGSLSSKLRWWEKCVHLDYAVEPEVDCPDCDANDATFV